MKILRIKLTNLNSLRGEHEINFESAPLRDASLFAITGPTGAGKSTILDAITLALYGRAARYSNTANPADMMSKHCGECQAEVEFSVATGRYRAVWQLWRSRKKADGNIQVPKRYLYDANGLPLAQATREVEDWIERVVGLDFHRFLRSVLLAQGEFAKFLKATADERAELLESLTATAIYTELSVLAYNEATRRNQELENKNAALGLIALLSPEDRAQRQTNIQDATAKLALLDTEISALNQQIAQTRERRELLTHEAAVLAAQSSLHQKVQLAGPDLARLAQHRLTLPFADELLQLDTAERHAAEQAAQLAKARDQHQSTQQAWINAVVEASNYAQQLQATAQARVLATEATVASRQQQQQEIQRWLSAHAEDQDLKSRLLEQIPQLTQLQSLRESLAKNQKANTGLDKKIRDQQATIETADKALLAANQSLQTHTQSLREAGSALESTIAGRNKETRADECDQIRSRSETITLLLQDSRSAQQKRAILDQYRQQLEDLAPQLTAAQSAINEAQSAKDAAELALSLHRDHLNKSALIASLDEHRAKLNPGEACPLCGATEHPALLSAPPLISLSAIEAQVVNSEKALRAAEKTASTAQQTFTRLTADHANLERSLATATRDLNAAEQKIRNLAAQHDLQYNATDDFAQSLQQTKAELEDLYLKRRAELTLIDRASETLNSAETARLKSENALRIADQAKQNAVDGLNALNGQLVEQQAQRLELEARLHTATTALLPLLTQARVAFPDPGQEQAACDSLTQRANAYQSQEKQFQTGVETLHQTQLQLQTDKQSLATLIAKAQPFHTQRAAQAHLANTSAQPQTALCATWHSVEDAEQTLRSLENSATATAASLAERQQQTQRATDNLSQLQQLLAARITGSAFATLTALRSAKLAGSDADRLHTLEQSFNSETDTLKGQLNQLRARLEQLPQSTDTVESFETALVSRQNSRDALLTDVSRWSDELGRDLQSQKQLAAKTAEIQADRQRLQIWSQLQGFIGSADGRKFRRYAQGISLDILVHYANAHLARLSDRYRLNRRDQQELELEIEDLDQAGVSRPMASLSGGESFLASLALALGLANLAGRNVQIDSLFIDEGFGSLDADTLDLAIAALDSLRQDNKTIGVISHVELLKERIATQIVVTKQYGGTSRLLVI